METVVTIVLGIVAIAIAGAIILVVGMIALVAIIGAIGGAIGGAALFAIGGIVAGADLAEAATLGAKVGAFFGAIGTPIYALFGKHEIQRDSTNEVTQYRTDSIPTSETRVLNGYENESYDLQAAIDAVIEAVHFELDVNLESNIDEAVESVVASANNGMAEYQNEYDIEEQIEDDFYDIISIECGRFDNIDFRDEVEYAVRSQLRPQIRAAVEIAIARYRSRLRMRRIR